MNLQEYMDIAPEVRQALYEGKPVVALESTIIFHGMPYPQNLECAARCEELIRAGGAVPATTAVVEGRIKVGLTHEDIDRMTERGHVLKMSRRDIARVVSGKEDGATTVASAVIIAELAGIPVFATGGIGGVHRGVQESFDISADLPQIAQSNVCVVCAGAKSILDIGFTLEYLETWGVPVLGYRTDEFPAFYTRKSGYAVDCRMESAEEIAQMLRAKWDLGLRGGVLVGCPVPERYAMDEAPINAAIEKALAEAKAQRIHGKESTPFILSKVLEATGGASLETNIQLVQNNCRTAAEIAAAYCALL
ncbi:MAG: pseudouridine-5'-phosphate glycosidase [Clostridiales Family XIII bacterium]|jgi:pseudouridine-5'-phosphate glycosidase|nr:pseudouridine-5'-phosphate glycosidase [Clostridiales Family XIII bacterium]